MSVLPPQPVCRLCDGPVDPLEKHYRATGDFLPPGDPLVPFCNTPLHWPCYAEWPQRPRFARHYVDAWVQANRQNPFWWLVHRDDLVYVSVNPQRPIEEASVRLYAIGNDIRIPLPRWSSWLAKPHEVTPGLHGFELEMLDEVLPLLRELLPDDHALVDAIDPAEKRPRARKASR
jgi:hypothetical protein